MRSTTFTSHSHNHLAAARRRAPGRHRVVAPSLQLSDAAASSVFRAVRLLEKQGTVIGLAGSLAGAALGLAGAAEFTGQLPARLVLLAAVAGLAGTVITATAAFLPARAMRRLPTARLLAEE